ncbi:hypothetical protein HDU85_000980 [Gaertneriomyces sp. JEL0708]|nr:hypothetical protein HDU85_000980 [Gaertneriomyces sp. JEL0708]
MENWDDGNPHPPCGCADNGIICKDCYFDGKNDVEIQEVKKRFREEHEEDEYLSALFTIATLKNIDFGALRKLVESMERSQGNKKAKSNDHERQTGGDVEGVEDVEIDDMLSSSSAKACSEGTGV